MPTFENELVTVALPAGWEDNSDAETMAFASSATAEELVISFAFLKARVDLPTMSGIVAQLLRHKASALAQASAETYKVLDAFEKYQSIPCSAMIAGHDSRNSTYSKVLITAQDGRVISASYYKHKCEVVSSEVTNRADEIIAACHTRVSGRGDR
jgi:hypothetical protein